MMKSVDVTMISAVMAFIASLIACNLAFKSKIHEESDWRKKLLELSYSELVSKRELIQLQSFVNPLAQFNDLKNLDGLINKFCQDEQAVVKRHGGYLPNKEAEKFRLLCRVLLKHDWIRQTAPFGLKRYKQHKLTKQLTQKFFRNWIVITE
ncbi:hypothetical protein [uncultured Limosilactobacillus sp.]|uniref:hypothetical protein n=1 Tax=uncultured Limosilactobacillus sp. TaxID=2837629 RepID=UPI0026002696|nr:hypothetical protein [uncultured Limosilactobacillus sp.]